jgi:hypothetical protein
MDQLGEDKNDIFRNQQSVLVKQEWAALECCDCEAKNRYRISVPRDGRYEGDVFLYVDEESGCLERICCSVNRSLELRVHSGTSKDDPVVQRMKKPFHLQGCCFCRPKFEVFGSASQLLGRVEDPCRICKMDQQVYDAQDNLLFTTYGSICQCGLYCPMCCDVSFDILKDGQEVGKITKMALTCSEACLKTNRFKIDFGTLQPMEKRMAFASAMLLDLEYFEKDKNGCGDS